MESKIEDWWSCQKLKTDEVGWLLVLESEDGRGRRNESTNMAISKKIKSKNCL